MPPPRDPHLAVLPTPSSGGCRRCSEGRGGGTAHWHLPPGLLPLLLRRLQRRLLPRGLPRRLPSGALMQNRLLDLLAISPVLQLQLLPALRGRLPRLLDGLGRVVQRPEVAASELLAVHPEADIPPLAPLVPCEAFVFIIFNALNLSLDKQPFSEDDGLSERFLLCVLSTPAVPHVISDFENLNAPLLVRIRPGGHPGIGGRAPEDAAHAAPLPAVAIRLPLQPLLPRLRSGNGPGY
mmetsp:Transcript_108522/g.263826  ORF Transcript_108522/g.263826 Transcript_108522/m.263826 type:complete len:237 (-) Transcript_108522:1015-1725(-)